MVEPGIRLIAEDEEDLKILSAHVQDSAFRIGDVAYLPSVRRFAVLLDRYCWEDDLVAGDAGRRIRSGLHFECVLSAKALGVPQNDPNAVMELVAIAYSPGVDNAGTIDLCLAGGTGIRLQVECIDASLRNMDSASVVTVPEDLEQKGEAL